jgi:ribosomal protein S18 acetylase RimI-like enzyme
LLPGFIATGERKACGYTYFMIARNKGVIGALYASPPYAQQAAEQMVCSAVENMREMRNLCRIEAQIIPLNGLDLNTIFTRHGFQHFLRHYLELDLSAAEWSEPVHSDTISPWSPSHLVPAADVAYRSYRNGIDAVICEDYRSQANCESYLRSLVENPGCGIFLPESSFVDLDRHGAPCGFILTSRISPASAMIPQISIHPSYQGRGLGTTLVKLALSRLRAAGFARVRLTVTHQNRRAYEWYQRLGFKTRRDFCAYLWLRD